jgi:hypothetical protein
MLKTIRPCRIETMALHQVQMDGSAARAVVRELWPDATSTYVGPTAAQVYDPASGTILGRVDSDEFAVERAWIAAANSARKSE